MDSFPAIGRMAQTFRSHAQLQAIRFGHLATRRSCVLLYSLLLVSAEALAADRTCVKESTCRCRLSDNSFYFDLLPMVEGTAAPHFRLPAGNVTYAYDPCREFNLVGTTSDCQSAAACKQEPEGGAIVNIGLQASSEFLYLEDTQPPLRILYHNGKSGAEQINTTVQLVCNTASISELTLKQSTATYYLFELRSAFACMKPIPSTTGLTPGGVLCIIFAVLVVVYFGGGFVYLFFFKYASGTKAIPHYEFWSSLPGLIRDGAVFLCECICGGRKKMTSSAPTYDAI